MRTNRPLALAMMVFYLGGCYSWTPRPVAQELVTAEQPSRIRITTLGGEQLVLDRPEVRNDSIVGMENDGITGISLQDIGQIETPSSNSGKAVKIGVGLAAAALVVVIVASAPKPEPDRCQKLWCW